MVIKTRNLFKLITHEDNFNFHKILGVSCLINFVYQFYQLFLYGKMNLQDNIYAPVLFLTHGALSLSSFIFRVPLNRHKGLPMIYKEFRLHSIVFALRSVFCGLAIYYRLDKIYNILIINLTMILADIATHNYKAETKTMRGMPFGADIKETDKKAVTQMHSSQQFGATLFMMTNIEGAFSPLLAIQLAAFLMTLVRKSIISELDWHRIYAISLWLNIFVYSSFADNINLAFYVIWGSYMFHYLRIVFTYNKYLVWNSILFTIYFLDNFFSEQMIEDEYYTNVFINLVITLYLVNNIYKTRALWI
jgi:hypothetical protein